jgi:hypothetical protein
LVPPVPAVPPLTLEEAPLVAPALLELPPAAFVLPPEGFDAPTPPFAFALEVPP